MTSSFDEFKAKLGEAADKLGDVAKETWNQISDAAEKAWDKASEKVSAMKGDDGGD
ncbi:MAG: hypothetical protein HOV83_34135, partial [Catenulispora sp.]|nr:hypothetical protein [Catenulispora sp.]